MSVSWLADLEAALFAELPAQDFGFVWEGEHYFCERTLEERNKAINFVEMWRDMRTEKAVFTWRLPIDPGAWMGLPETLKASTLQVLLLSIARSRPTRRVPTSDDEFVPSRFGVAPRIAIR